MRAQHSAWTVGGSQYVIAVANVSPAGAEEAGAGKSIQNRRAAWGQ